VFGRDVPEAVWRPTDELRADSRLAGFLRATGGADLEALQARAVDDPAWFWGAAAADLDLAWQRQPDQVMDASGGPEWTRWWRGGAFNHAEASSASRAARDPDGDAVAWEGEDGAVRRLTNGRLHDEVVAAARMFSAQGIRPGDRVMIEKGGEIIPKIISVNLEKRKPDAAPIVYRTTCPDCDTLLERKEGEAAFYCPNDEGCPTQIVGKMQHFTGRKVMDIDGLGDETIETLYQKGFISHISDIYDLHNKADQLKTMERFGEKSINNMLDGIEKSKQMPFDRVLFGLGIRYVGATVAKKLTAHFKTIDNLIAASFDELNAVEEIGERIAHSIIEYFADEKHREEIEKLKAQGLQFVAEQKEVTLASEKLVGKTFIISGTFEKFSRDELKDIIEQNGGKILSSISPKLNYLVAGDNMGPAKLEKATKLNIPIISDDELMGML